MKTLLIFIILTQAGATSNSVPFKSEQSCDAVRADINIRFGQALLYAKCVEP